MKTQQGAPEALVLAAQAVVKADDQQALNQNLIERLRAALVEAQQPAAHVQNPAEIEHVAGDVSKNGPESNMAQQAACGNTPYDEGPFTLAQQPAPSAAAVEHGDGFMEAINEMDELRPFQAAPQPSPTPQADSAPAEAVQRIVHLRADRERRVYVAGPMTGLPEYNFPLFNATAARLRSEGWHVENPAEHGHVEGAGWSDYLRWDISRIATCGAIYLLPGWSKSKGATLEVHVAGVLGLQVLLADGAEAPQADSQPALDRARIREIFMAHGFTVKEGQTDLKQYVYDAAEALLRAARAPADSVTTPAGGVTAEPGWKSEDFEVTHYPPMPTTGLLVGMPKGVKVTHRPTGLFAVSEDERSQHRNREVAWNRLQEILAAQPTPPAQAADSVLEDAARWRAVEAMVEDVSGGDGHMVIVMTRNAKPEPFLQRFLADKIDVLRAARKQGANHD